MKDNHAGLGKYWVGNPLKRIRSFVLLFMDNIVQIPYVDSFVPSS